MTLQSYAKTLTSVGGGTPSPGGVVATTGQTIALTGENDTLWVSALWEIYFYPPGFAPGGTWALGADGYTWQNTNIRPSSFSTSSFWGKWMVQLTVDGGIRNGISASIQTSHADGSVTISNPLVDTAGAIAVASPTGLQTIAAGEQSQFGRTWAHELDATLRTLDGAVALVSGAALPAIAATNINAGDVVCSANDTTNTAKISRATPSALAAGGAVLGVSLATVLAGASTTYAGAGAVVATTLTPGTAGFVGVDSSAHLTYDLTPAAGDQIVGVAATSGLLTVSPWVAETLALSRIQGPLATATSISDVFLDQQRPLMIAVRTFCPPRALSHFGALLGNALRPYLLSDVYGTTSVSAALTQLTIDFPLLVAGIGAGNIIGQAAPAWSSLTFVPTDAIVVSGGYMYRANYQGLTGTVAPTFPAVVGGTVVDGSPRSTTIAAGSNGATLSSAGTINVASTAGFASAGNILVASSTGTWLVSYTGTTGTSFTGCVFAGLSSNASAVLGTLATGGGVFDATPLTTTIAAGSNGVSLPAATINVASTAGYPTAGKIYVTTSLGVGWIVEYTGTTPTSFTGCSGGSGVLATGAAVTSPPPIVWRCVCAAPAPTLDQYSLDWACWAEAALFAESVYRTTVHPDPGSYGLMSPPWQAIRLRAGIAIVGQGAQGTNNALGTAITHFSCGDLFVWDATFPGFASSGFSGYCGTGGALRNLTIFKADRSGLGGLGPYVGGNAMHELAQDVSGAHRPGEMLYENVVVATEGAGASGFDRGWFIDGTAAVIQASMGVRTTVFVKCRAGNTRMPRESIRLDMAEHVFAVGLDVDQGTSAEAGIMINGYCDHILLSGVICGGPLTTNDVPGPFGPSPDSFSISGKLASVILNATQTNGTIMGLIQSKIVNASPNLRIVVPTAPCGELDRITTLAAITGDGTEAQLTFDSLVLDQNPDVGFSAVPPITQVPISAAGRYRFNVSALLSGIIAANVGTFATLEIKLFNPSGFSTRTYTLRKTIDALPSGGYMQIGPLVTPPVQVPAGYFVRAFVTVSGNGSKNVGVYGDAGSNFTILGWELI